MTIALTALAVIVLLLFLAWDGSENGCFVTYAVTALIVLWAVAWLGQLIDGALS